MSFEKIVKNISSFVAAVVVFFFAAGWYLSMKGFIMDADYNITLVSPATAKEAPKGFATTDVPIDLVLPKGRAMGDENAPITIYEYSSLGCSHCASFHLSILPKIKEQYIDKGLVKLVFVDFPIDQKSMKATMVALCADDDKYFAMLEVLFRKQREWWLAINTEKKLKQYASLGGLTAEKIDVCLKNSDIAQEVLNNRQQAIKDLQVQGTPAFVIDGNGRREMISGALYFDTIKNIIDDYLSKDNEPIMEIQN